MPRESDRGERASEHAEDFDFLPKAVEDLVAGSPSIRFDPIISRWSLDEKKLNRDKLTTN